MNFGEKKKEYHKTHGEIEVWQSPKYEQSKKKAIELINDKKYGLESGDFWILMNATQTKKMMYTGLIMSHNACLKINDKLDEQSQFKSESVSVDKDGYNNSLVFTYSCASQGLYEVGEVNKSNCKNDYIYAMGIKRLFDRVVLKLSKIAFHGIYSENESEDFKHNNEPIQQVSPEHTAPKAKVETSSTEGFKCSDCGASITEKIYNFSTGKHGKALCFKCQKK